MKIVESIDRNDVFNYLVDEVDVYSFDPIVNTILNLRYEYVATVVGLLENDDVAMFIIVDDRNKGGEQK